MTTQCRVVCGNGMLLFNIILLGFLVVSNTTNINAIISLVAKGYRLKQPFYEKEVNGLIECSHNCLSQYTRCRSINYSDRKTGRNKNICQLNNITNRNRDMFVLDNKFHYYEIIQLQKDFKYISLDVEKNDQPSKFRSFQARFTTLGGSGRSGPTSIAAQYSNKDQDGSVTVTSGIQYWTVPYTGTYQIIAIGAAGGYDTSGATARGRGAYMQGDFDLIQGDVIKLLVGQTGLVNNAHTTSGGGGGTFVATWNDQPLLVAGGGGGIESLTTRLVNSDGSINTSGRNNKCKNSCANWAGGVNGNGSLEADSGNSGGGGGGFYSNGRSSQQFGGAFGNGGEGGYGFIQGGEGGRSWYYNGEGGFGGGGGAYGNGGGPGGGGGYSGGASGDNVLGSCGGGGGSYNVGRNQINKSGWNDNGDGYIEILYVNLVSLL